MYSNDSIFPLGKSIDAGIQIKGMEYGVCYNSHHHIYLCSLSYSKGMLNSLILYLHANPRQLGLKLVELHSFRKVKMAHTYDYCC